MEELNVILKYRRKEEQWICPGCETENSTSVGNCKLCGEIRSHDVIVLKAWSPQDDVPPVVKPPQKVQASYNPQMSYTPPVHRAAPVHHVPPERIFVDTEKYTPPPKKSHKGVIFVVALLIIGIIVTVGLVIYFGTKDKIYSEAMDEFNNGNYEAAIEKFEQLPLEYRDVEEMIDESNYQLGIEYKNYGDYAKAMGQFYSLGSYGDSSSQLVYVENELIHENKENKYFSNMDFMLGSWYDDNGYRVIYEKNYDNSVGVDFNLPSATGETYKLLYDGIHYHGDIECTYLEKQWIYQIINNNTVDVFNYTDGSTYTLTRQ